MHPIAFEFGKLSVHWYGILTAIGFLLGFWTASKRGVRDGIAPAKIMDFAPWVLFGGIFGARILYVTTHWQQDFAGKPFTDVFMVQRGGLVFYGGFISGALVTIFYARWKQIPLWKFADALAPSIALGHMFGRLGCLMTGCCYGKKCELPWAIRFPVGHDTHPVGQAALPVHPTQIYESLLNLCLYLFLAWLYRRKKFDGQIFATYLLCYAVIRSFVELFRGDYAPAEYRGMLSPGQMVSVFIISAGLLLFFKLRPAAAAKK